MHYSKVVDRIKSNAEVLSTKVVSLTCNMVTSEVQRKRAEAQANRSTRRAAEVTAHSSTLEQRIKELEAIVKTQNNQIMELEDNLIGRIINFKNWRRRYQSKYFAKFVMAKEEQRHGLILSGN